MDQNLLPRNTLDLSWWMHRQRPALTVWMETTLVLLSPFSWNFKSPTTKPPYTPAIYCTVHYIKVSCRLALVEPLIKDRSFQLFIFLIIIDVMFLAIFLVLISLLYILLSKKRLSVGHVNADITTTFNCLSYFLFVFASSLLLLLPLPPPFPSKIVNTHFVKNSVSAQTLRTSLLWCPVLLWYAIPILLLVYLQFWLQICDMRISRLSFQVVFLNLSWLFFLIVISCRAFLNTLLDFTLGIYD